MNPFKNIQIYRNLPKSIQILSKSIYVVSSVATRQDWKSLVKLDNPRNVVIAEQTTPRPHTLRLVSIETTIGKLLFGYSNRQAFVWLY